MNLTSYLNLYELLQNDNASREENRAFGLAHVALKDDPLAQLSTWADKYKKQLVTPSMGDSLSAYLYGVTLTLSILSLILGFVSGFALLSYSGHEPVNVVYFIAMVVFFPLFTMGLALLSMLRANRARSMLVHISPAFWMEKLLSFLPNSIQDNIKSYKVNPLLLNWIVIKRSQVIALFFSLGLFLALVGLVITKDIAFAWSTTLHVTPDAFYHILETISFGWKEWWPSAVPSLELIEKSQYFRLGDKLSEEMISNASKLGEWWKFLAMATLFYAVFLRFLIYLLASFGVRKAIQKSSLSLKGARKLLSEMNEPLISTRADNNEDIFVPSKESYSQIVQRLDSSYDVVHGWAIDKDNLVVLSDSLGIHTPLFYEVGGANSFDEDNEIIVKSKGEVLFFVKGWEPPTMDFVDYLQSLSHQVDKIIVVPIGTAEDDYSIEAEDVNVWDRKLTQLNEENVWLKR